jgi:putative resolvase
MFDETNFAGRCAALETLFLNRCAAKGYQIAAAVKEVVSGVNDTRPRFLALLRDPTITLIVVEHEDRATPSGSAIWKPDWRCRGGALKSSI